MRTIIALLLVAATCFGRDLQVSNVQEFRAASRRVNPGDNIVLSEGEWRDALIVLQARGTLEQPVTLRAAVAGKTILTGRSSIRLAGQYLVIDGLSFRDPDPEVSDLIQFRNDSDELASYCRMTNCAVVSERRGSSTRESRWVGVYGNDNQVDHCSFVGKPGKGATFVVWLGDASDGHHRIDHNYFGPRELLGKNGGETIRVGDSKTAELDARCIIESNLFERCNGETECISNKSCRNVYRENTFLEVSGSLTLRHGNGCLVEKNVFIGNKAQGTGGIRIVGEDHVIRGNYLQDLTGDDARAAICLMMGIPNSPANRYRQVKGAVIEDNSIVNCKHPILIGLSDDENAILPPRSTVFQGNKVESPKYLILEARCSLDGIQWTANSFTGKLGTAPEDGINEPGGTVRDLKPISRSAVGPAW